MGLKILTNVIYFTTQMRFKPLCRVFHRNSISLCLLQFDASQYSSSLISLMYILKKLILNLLCYVEPSFWVFQIRTWYSLHPYYLYNSSRVFPELRNWLVLINVSIIVKYNFNLILVYNNRTLCGLRYLSQQYCVIFYNSLMLCYNTL